MGVEQTGGPNLARSERQWQRQSPALEFDHHGLLVVVIDTEDC
jgi:hypothetical protein